MFSSMNVMSIHDNIVDTTTTTTTTTIVDVPTSTYYYKCESGDKVGSLLYNWYSGSSSSTNAASFSQSITTANYKIGSASAIITAGSTNGFNFPSTVVAETSLTFAFWIYITSMSSSNTWLFRIEFNNNAANIYYRANGSAYILLENAGSGNGGAISSSSMLNAWYHIAVVFDYANLSVINYTNGSLYNTTTYTSTSYPSPAGSISSGNRGMPHSTMGCYLDDIRLYPTTALSSDQIYSLYTTV
jgi:hypothetical protein